MDLYISQSFPLDCRLQSSRCILLIENYELQFNLITLVLVTIVCCVDDMTFQIFNLPMQMPYQY